MAGLNLGRLGVTFIRFFIFEREYSQTDYINQYPYKEGTIEGIISISASALLCS